VVSVCVVLSPRIPTSSRCSSSVPVASSALLRDVLAVTFVAEAVATADDAGWSWRCARNCSRRFLTRSALVTRVSAMPNAVFRRYIGDWNALPCSHAAAQRIEECRKRRFLECQRSHADHRMNVSHKSVLLWLVGAAAIDQSRVSLVPPRAQRKLGRSARS
jgi:hypothetical protein